DVMLSAFRSFFRRNAEGQFALSTWEELWALLTLITLRKCGYQTRHYRAACRDVRRDVALPHGEEETAAWELIAREPTPEEAALHAETVEQTFRGLSQNGRLVLELSLQGYTAPEIIDRGEISGRSVYRLREHIREKLERQCDPGV